MTIHAIELKLPFVRLQTAVYAAQPAPPKPATVVARAIETAPDAIDSPPTDATLECLRFALIASVGH